MARLSGLAVMAAEGGLAHSTRGRSRTPIRNSGALFEDLLPPIPARQRRTKFFVLQ